MFKERNVKFIFAAIIIIGLYYLSVVIINVQPILAPIAIGLLLALALVPLAKLLEKAGLVRWLASIICTLLVTALLFGIGWGAIEYIASLRTSFSDIWSEIEPRLNELSSWISNKFNLESFDLIERTKTYLSDSSSSIGRRTFTAIGSAFNGLGNLLLIIVNTFFILNYRKHFANFLFKLTRENNNINVSIILSNSVKIVRKYLVGRLLLIVILSILYGIGFTVIGLDYAWPIAIVSAFFSILPIIGNILAALLTSALALLTTGDPMMIVYVLIIFSLTQFIESYILTPLILGNEVDLHPFFSVVVVLIGGAFWGFEGYLLALPYFGILKVILDQSDSTRPYAYLLGNEGNSDHDVGDKIKDKVKKMKEKIS